MKRNLKIITIIITIIVIFLSLFGLRKIILKRFYPIEYSEEVEKYSKEYNVDKNLIYAIIKAESNFNEKAESSKGAKGLMQLMYTTAKDVAKKVDIEIDEEKILEPNININLGTKYISILLEKYHNNELALAAYNAGSGNVDNWIEENTLKKDGTDAEKIPYKETNNYVRKILRSYKIYKNLYK